MASLIPGYEYDIFISYRQKDNKYDGWVSEFVSNLKKELEATVKEDISIFFDLNPFDGILSSHDIDKSLQAKLKCLIIIPILSHTYCDITSYAWQYEFCAFNKLTKIDKYGTTIKLQNGNVTSRILPVKIHHLDNSDLQLIQIETGSVPRSIDFIYEEPGVNRPLRPNDDKKENVNKTDYRNQINKLANVIKDIFDSLKLGQQQLFISQRSNWCTLNNGQVSIKSIAVLPFVNLNKDREQEYLGAGIAEDLINSLVHLPDLKVSGFMSSQKFKSNENDLREAGTKLGVCNVLVGSVRIYGKKLKMTVQLVSVEDGFNIWSEKYDRSVDDLFTILDEIVIAIIEILKVTVYINEREKLTRNYTKNREAYEYFLKGKFYIHKRGPHILTSIKYFQKAIDLDPDFALAHAGYADANLLIASYGFVPPKLVKNKIKLSAETAIRLNPEICEPYGSLGYFHTCFDWNWKEAKKCFLKSLELNPNYVQAHYWYGWNYLTWVEGDCEEAEKHGRMAINLEPLSALCYGIYSRILHACGKYLQALQVCQKGLELEPNSYLCRLNEGNTYLSMQRYDLSLSSFESASKISNRHHFALNGLIWANYKLGQINEAKKLMIEVKRKSQKECVGFTLTAISAAYLNDLDFAFTCLEKAFDDLDPFIMTIKKESWYPLILRQDARFQKLVDRIYHENHALS